MTDEPLILKKTSNGQEVPIAGQVSVGRAEDSTLRLSEGQPSRRHALITREGSAVFVEDLHSANGTFVNDRRIDADVKVKLSTGDCVRFDTESFVFLDAASAEALEQTLPRDSDGQKTALNPAPEEKRALPDSFFQKSGKETTFIPPEKRAAARARLTTAVPEMQPSGETPYLRIVSGDRIGTQFMLPVDAETSKTWNIGSQADRDICLHEPEVSAKHATLKHEKNAWLLSDNLSANGTSVNGEKILTRYLSDGDRLQFGLVECEFRIPPRAQVQDSSTRLKKRTLIAVGAFILTLILLIIAFVLMR